MCVCACVSVCVCVFVCASLSLSMSLSVCMCERERERERERAREREGELHDDTRKRFPSALSLGKCEKALAHSRPYRGPPLMRNSLSPRTLCIVLL